MANTELVTTDKEQRMEEVALASITFPRKAPWITRIEEHPAWPVLAKQAVRISAEIALKQFRVCDLLGLQKGQVFETAWPESEDVPLMAGKVQLAWSEFEVADHQLVVRLTRLA